MNFIESVTTCLTKYFTFEGVASRSEFWWFQLFYMIAIFTGITFDGNWDNPDVITGGLAETTFTLILVIPAITVSCRRLHDIDKSGWWQLIGLTIVGYIPLFYWWCKEGGNPSKYTGGYFKK